MTLEEMENKYSELERQIRVIKLPYEMLIEEHEELLKYAESLERELYKLGYTEAPNA